MTRFRITRVDLKRGTRAGHWVLSRYGYLVIWDTTPTYLIPRVSSEDWLIHVTSFTFQ